jgi:hypothetical protein
VLAPKRENVRAKVARSGEYKGMLQKLYRTGQSVSRSGTVADTLGDTAHEQESAPLWLGTNFALGKFWVHKLERRLLLRYEDLVQSAPRSILRFPGEEDGGPFVTRQEIVPEVSRTCCKNDGRYQNGTIGSSLMNDENAR